MVNSCLLAASAVETMPPPDRNSQANAVHHHSRETHQVSIKPTEACASITSVLGQASRSSVARIEAEALPLSRPA